MFWNDPNLYGATFPYRDIPSVQTPFMGPVIPQWQTIPRFLPMTHAFAPPAFNVPPIGFDPFLHRAAITPPMFNVPPIGLDPFLQRAGIHPYAMPLNPYVQPFNPNLPLYNLYRPYV